jgi:hypothetical protein
MHSLNQNVSPKPTSNLQETSQTALPAMYDDWPSTRNFRLFFQNFKQKMHEAFRLLWQCLVGPSGKMVMMDNTLLSTWLEILAFWRLQK